MGEGQIKPGIRPAGGSGSRFANPIKSLSPVSKGEHGPSPKHAGEATSTAVTATDLKSVSVPPLPITYHPHLGRHLSWLALAPSNSPTDILTAVWEFAKEEQALASLKTALPATVLGDAQPALIVTLEKAQPASVGNHDYAALRMALMLYSVPDLGVHDETGFGLLTGAGYVLEAAHISGSQWGFCEMFLRLARSSAVDRFLAPAKALADPVAWKFTPSPEDQPRIIDPPAIVKTKQYAEHVLNNNHNHHDSHSNSDGGSHPADGVGGEHMAIHHRAIRLDHIHGVNNHGHSGAH
jgi:hypothetical protein